MREQFGPPGGRCYSTREVSSMLGVNESTVKRWSDSGKLTCFKTLGGHRRYTPGRILEFVERFKYDVGSTLSNPIQRKSSGENPIDLLLKKKDYRTLREVFFADALKGDIESMTIMLVRCSSSAGISVSRIYEEFVSRTINKIRKLGREEKLNLDQQENSIDVILESFFRLKDLVRTNP